MEQCNRLELKLGEIVECMGGTGCEGVCLNMHSIVHMLHIASVCGCHG